MGVGVAIALGATLASITIAQVAVTAIVLGTILTVAGTITENKTLSYIGMGIGLAGGLTSLAGAAGLFASGTTVSSLFGGAAASSTAAAGSGAVAVGSAAAGSIAPVAAESAAPVVASSIAPATASAVGQGAALGAPAASAVAPAVNAVGQTAADVAIGQSMSSAANWLPATTGGGTGLVGAGSTVAGSVAPLVKPVLAPGAPTVQDSFTSMASQGGLTPPRPDETAGNWFKNLGPSDKLSLAVLGGQGVSGMFGGMFASRSQSEQLELQRLIQQQRQTLGLKQLDIEQGRLDLNKAQFGRATSSPGIVSFGG